MCFEKSGFLFLTLLHTHKAPQFCMLIVKTFSMYFFYKEDIKEGLTQEVEIIIYFRGNETKVQ